MCEQGRLLYAVSIFLAKPRRHRLSIGDNSACIHVLYLRRGWGTLYKGLYLKAPPLWVTFYRLQVYERAGISPVEMCERVGKSVISVCKKAQKG